MKLKLDWNSIFTAVTIAGLGAGTGFAVDFQFLKKDVKELQTKVEVIETKISAVYEILCDDAIEKAQTDAERDKAKKRCNRTN